MLLRVIREIKVSSGWFGCVLVIFSRREGVPGNGQVVVFLFHQCITFFRDA